MHRDAQAMDKVIALLIIYKINTLRLIHYITFNLEF